MIGPFRGGRAITATGVSTAPNTFYFGAVGGGLWKTTNAGLTWNPLFDSAPVSSIGAIAVAAANPSTIFVATGEADIRSNVSFGNGVYKSTDGGSNWSFIGLKDTGHISRIWVDPHDPNRVLVAALGHAYGPNPERGVFRSIDGGNSWKKVLYKGENIGAIDLAVDPADSTIIFATLWNAYRPPWDAYEPIQGPGSGIYKSEDGGNTWRQITGGGLPAADWKRVAVAVATPGKMPRVYALIDAKQNKGLYRSDDGGSTWIQTCSDSRITEREWYFGTITVDPKNPDVVYLPTVSLMRSTDGGKTFEAFKGAPGGDDYHLLWIDPQNTRQMILAGDQGAIITVDGGETWSTWLNQPTAQFYHVATDNQFPYYVYGAQQDSGTVATASRSDYGGLTYREWYSVGGGESGYIVPDPTNPNIVYAGDTFGKLWRFDRITGQSQDISPNPVTVWGTEMTDKKLRFTWTSPLVISQQDPATLYFGSQFVMKTTNRGASWQIVSPDLTGSDPDSHSEDPVTLANAKSRGYGVVYSIALSPLDPNTIWAGSDTGLIYATRDGAKTWTSVAPKGLAAWSKISILEPSHFDGATVYAAVDGHRLDDYTPHILRTRDGGQSWQEIGVGIAAPDYVHVVREDPLRKGLLYAGTDMGVYVSFDEGDHWQSLKLNLPAAAVHDLVIHGDDLVIATHGRSFWILDDIEPLREITAELASLSQHLFRPQTAVRVYGNVNVDTPLPPETPVGANPPAGAVIDYYLSRDANEVTLEVLDSHGNLVRRFSSADLPEAVPIDLEFPTYWIRPAAALAKEAGMHRFVWDLRYPKPPVVKHEYGSATVFGQTTPESTLGAIALPGDYQVVLKVDGRTQVEPLTLRKDPRVATSEKDLAAQFELETRLSAALSKNYAALQDARELRTRLESIAYRTEDGSGPDDVMLSIKSLDAKTGALAEDPEPGAGANMAGLNRRLATLLAAVETADAAPTAQETAAAEDLLAELSGQLNAWEKLKIANLTALNQASNHVTGSAKKGGGK